MTRKWRGWVLVCATAIMMPSCGHDQQLVSMAIEPTIETFGAPNVPVNLDAGLNVQLRALGSYIHPPVTKDVTSQVTWVSNTPGIATVSSSGLLTATGQDCGTGLVSATITTNNKGTVHSNGAIVTGTMTVNVVCFTGSGGGAAITVSVTGNGTVASSPAGISCPTVCAAIFATTPVTLTATPNSGSSFGSWSGCDSVSGTNCIISSLTSNRAVAVIFN